MAYSDKVIDHYENPRNVGSLNKEDPNVGTGMVGAPACGDVMKLQIKVNQQGIIEEAKFKTYGCGSAIASSSLVTEWVKGKSVEDAAKIRNTRSLLRFSTIDLVYLSNKKIPFIITNTMHTKAHETIISIQAE